MESLQQLGLSLYERKIYHTLLEFGRLNAREIAQESEVPPTAVYPNLKALVHKNLVQQFSGEVSLFEAINPKVAIPAFISQKKEELEILEKNVMEESNLLFHRKQLEKVPEVLNLSMGKEASSAIYADVLTRVKKTFFVLGWNFYNAGNKMVKLHHLLKAQKRGVEVRIIMVGSRNKDWSVVRAYHDAGLPLRYYPLENFSLLVADQRECKITLKSKEYQQKFNLQIKDASLAKALHLYYLSLWEKGERIETRELKRV